MDIVWTKNASCHTLRKNTRHTAGTKRKKCHTLRKNTRHTASTKRKKCHKCYAYTALTTIHQIPILLEKIKEIKRYKGITSFNANNTNVTLATIRQADTLLKKSIKLSRLVLFLPYWT